MALLRKWLGVADCWAAALDASLTMPWMSPACACAALPRVSGVALQVAQQWPTVAAGSPEYQAQQSVVDSFIKNVLRSSRGSLTGGADHSAYR